MPSINRLKPVDDRKQAFSAARTVVYRKPLRAKTGCVKCRERRKKCDEQKPVCGDCKRLFYTCVWTKSNQKVPRLQRSPQKEDESMRQLIVETYHMHRDEMVVLPSVEYMIRNWFEYSCGEALAPPLMERSWSSSDTGSSSTDNGDDRSPSPSFKLRDNWDDLVPHMITPGIGETPNVDKSEGYIFERAAPIWRQIFTEFQNIDPAESAEDQHIIISVILHGWEETIRFCGLSRMWTTFQQLYEPLGFAERPQVERLALLDLNWRLARTEASKQFKTGVYGGFLPQHFDTRPLNKYLPNPRAPTIKFFPWPGVREHMALRPLRYRKDLFIQSLHSEFRFIFPSIEDAYCINRSTGLYAFTNQYLEMRDNLSAWTVTSDFFEIFPELRDDIPTFNPQLGLVQPTGVGSGVGAGAGMSYDATRRRFEVWKYDDGGPYNTWPTLEEYFQDDYFDFSQFLVDF